MQGTAAPLPPTDLSPSEYPGGWKWCWRKLPPELRWALVFLLPVITGLALGRATACPTVGAQVAGVLFEASGLFIVWQGLDEIARKQRLKTTGQRLYAWWYPWTVFEAADTRSYRYKVVARWLRWVSGGNVTVALTGIQANIALAGIGVATTVTPFTSTNVPDQVSELQRRVLELEHEIKISKRDLAATKKEIEADVVAAEKRAMEKIDAMADRVKIITGEGIHFEAFGLLLVLLGAVCTTFAEPIGQHFPFAL